VCESHLTSTPVEKCRGYGKRLRECESILTSTPVEMCRRGGPVGLRLKSQKIGCRHVLLLLSLTATSRFFDNLRNK
jgi:hypothetical protein